MCSIDQLFCARSTAEDHLRTLGLWHLALELQAPQGADSNGTSSNVLNLVANATPVSRGVLVILALFSITCWGIILYKSWVFRRSARQSSSFLDVFRRSNKFSEVQAVCRSL